MDISRLFDSQPQDMQQAIDEIKQESGFNKTLNVVFSDVTSISYPGGTTGFWNAQLDHNLGYIPSYICFADVGGGQRLPLPHIEFTPGSTAIVSTLSVQADATSIYFSLQYYVNKPALTMNIKAYLFAEPAALT